MKTKLEVSIPGEADRHFPVDTRAVIGKGPTADISLDVPGVIGHVGTVLGRNSINIANFSLGRREGAPANATADAVAVVSTDGLVPDTVLSQLRENAAVQIARSVEFK